MCYFTTNNIASNINGDHTTMWSNRTYSLVRIALRWRLADCVAPLHHLPLGLDVPVSTHQSKVFFGENSCSFQMSTPTTQAADAPAAPAAANTVVASTATTTSSSASTASNDTSTVMMSSPPPSELVAWRVQEDACGEAGERL
ncbi:unnamed protein product [Phytophthora fragariaefolia]|uniref:Unnamed protein product n=1 Tax=Phytophthora fragariaefolia TaxID=1490495 RepID=A0A9W7CTX9_9STRA|nr:unnamed protein product [Phytophthora fragariaefolia]